MSGRSGTISRRKLQPINPLPPLTRMRFKDLLPKAGGQGSEHETFWDALCELQVRKRSLMAGHPQVGRAMPGHTATLIVRSSRSAAVRLRLTSSAPFTEENRRSSRVRSTRLQTQERRRGRLYDHRVSVRKHPASLRLLYSASPYPRPPALYHPGGGP